MPRYDALIDPRTSKTEYQRAREMFKCVCASMFSSSTRQLDSGDFYGPAMPQESDDLPEGAQVVFVLFLDIDGRDLTSDKRDDIADLITWQVLVHAGVHVRVGLEFPPIGWSFLKSENIASGLTAHVGSTAMELFERFGGGRE